MRDERKVQEVIGLILSRALLTKPSTATMQLYAALARFAQSH
jgi:hypothetical protein